MTLLYVLPLLLGKYLFRSSAPNRDDHDEFHRIWS